MPHFFFLFLEKHYQGKSTFGMIDENRPIEVVQVSESTIIVQECNPA